MREARSSRRRSIEPANTTRAASRRRDTDCDRDAARPAVLGPAPVRVRRDTAGHRTHQQAENQRRGHNGRRRPTCRLAQRQRGDQPGQHRTQQRNSAGDGVAGPLVTLSRARPSIRRQATSAFARDRQRTSAALQIRRRSSESKPLQVLQPPRPPSDTPNRSADVWCCSQLDRMDTGGTALCRSRSGGLPGRI